jgi:hypothetical protein
MFPVDFKKKKNVLFYTLKKSSFYVTIAPIAPTLFMRGDGGIA